MFRNLSIVLALILTSVAFSAEPKVDAKSASTSESRTQTLKGFIYFHTDTRATFQNIGDKAKALIPELQKALAESHAHADGPIIFVYHGVTDDPNKEFDLQIGCPIAEKVNAAGNFKVTELPEYSCMSVVFSGPLMQLSSAYEKLIPAAMNGTKKMTGESREMFLYFEGPQSENNVTHVSVGVK